MTGRQLAYGLAVALAAAAAAYLMLSGRVQLSVGADAGTGEPRLTGLRQRHPLFRRPDYPGCHLTRISRGGWAWYLDPPSSEVL
jgi:hypothetical protein